MQYSGMIMVEAVYVNNIKPTLREQSKVEKKLKYRSVLTVCGMTVTPRVQRSSVKFSLGLSSLISTCRTTGMQLLLVSKSGKRA